MAKWRESHYYSPHVAGKELTTSGEKAAALRASLAQQGLDGFIVPRTDEYQGEYLPESGRTAGMGHMALSGFRRAAPSILKRQGRGHVRTAAMSSR